MSIKLEKYKEAPELIDLSWDITIDNHAGNNIFSILSSCDPINSITRLCKTVKRHDGGEVIKTDIESTVLLREFRDYAIESILNFAESYNIDKLGTDWLKLIYRSETESSTVLNDNERKLLEYIYNYCSWSKNITDKAHVTYDGTYLLRLF
jgi:hypothetical protein